MRFSPSSGGHVATTLIAIIGSGLMALHAAAVTQDDSTTATANGGVSIDVPPLTLGDGADASTEPRDQTPATPDDTSAPVELDDDATDQAALDDESAVDAAMTESTWTPPARESQGLGTPRSLFELGDDEALDAAASDVEKSESNTLAALDPRQNDVIRVLLALAFVVGLLLATKKMLVRKGGIMTQGGRPSGVLEILARYPLARGQQLMILKMGRRVMLLHHAGEKLTPISEVTNNEEVATLLSRIEAGGRSSRNNSAAGFNAMLENFRRPQASTATSTNGRPTRSTTSDDRVIDLTRTKRRGLAGLLSSGKAGR